MLGAGAALGATAATLAASATGGAIAGGVVSKIYKYLIHCLKQANLYLPIGVGA